MHEPNRIFYKRGRLYGIGLMILIAGMGVLAAHFDTCPLGVASRPWFDVTLLLLVGWLIYRWIDLKRDIRSFRKLSR